MSENRPIVLDLAKLKQFKYAQVDILNGLKEMVRQNNIILELLSRTTENNIQALINLENASTISDDNGKTEYYE